MVSFILNGQMKSGKNRILITRFGKRYPPKEFVTWRDGMLKQLRPHVPKQPLEGDLEVWIAYTPGDKIKRDVPGIIDALFHLFERSGLVRDDAQFKNVHFRTWSVDKAQCGVVIEIRRMCEQ